MNPTYISAILQCKFITFHTRELAALGLSARSHYRRWDKLGVFLAPACVIFVPFAALSQCCSKLLSIGHMRDENCTFCSPDFHFCLALY